MRPRNPTEDDLKQFEANMRKIKDTVRGSTEARRTTAKGGSSCEAAIQQTKSRSGESALSPMTLSLTGPMVSGKNQVQLLFRNGKVHKYPNKSFTNWRQRSHMQIMEQWDLSRSHVTLLIVPVHLTVDLWPHDLRTRDITGMADALFHLLVYAKVLKDDGLIRGLVWREHDVNRKFPKLVMEIRPL